ncbi:uncharacterized protein LOC134241631 [Saccostrea cucullata]|uniref:uncharacterized protein LOC134241631 n=1 Tax=Saccostrea cuccullata TaxID=36930 RepID=UPI002ED5ED3B
MHNVDSEEKDGNNETMLLTDLQTWERRMRLREFFFNEEDDESSDTDEQYEKKKSNSKWTPEEGRDKWLDEYIRQVKEDVIRGLSRNFSSNITISEESAMRELLEDPNIIIRPADKGSGVVVMDTDKYVDQVENEMLNSSSYSEVKEDRSQQITNKIKKLVNNMHKRGSISTELRHYLLPTEISSGKLQANPKVHKKNHPLRTIVNGRQHPTEKLAEYVELQLEDANKSLKSYIQDTTDFLRKLSTLNQPLPNSSLLFCMDVKSLYPSIPRKEAREVIKRILEERQKKEVDTDSILEMMDAVLDNNNFSFNNKHYIQTEGTAIGSKLGRNYACVYMGEWENILLAICKQQPLFYLRYIDDIFGIWTGTEEELHDFHMTANNIHPNIQLDLRFSKTKIDFLDVSISLDNGFLTTDLYSKPTDKHMYLNKTSSHPESTKSSIPYGLGLRARRICSTEENYQSQRDKVKKNLRKRGYSSNEEGINTTR